MNILIVEPSKTYQLALEKIFTPYGTLFFFSESGVEAENIYSSVSIDLICLSFYLADMDGLEFVARVREMRWGKTVPILMITTKESQDTTVKSFHLGVTEVFRKNNLMALEKFLMTYAEYAYQQANLAGTILLIDSDRQQAEIICKYFEDTVLKFVHFTSAEEAANIARAAEFDLVITNVILSGPMSGMALIRDVRQINETMYRIPILAITDAANVSQKIELLRAGANDSVCKPVLLEELSVRVKNLLQNKKLFDTVELQKKQLEEMAFRDPLTGLYNRHHLLEIANRIMEECYRYDYPVSIMIIDLDHFKKVNDTYGHATGDKVLKALGELLLRTFRGADTPVRFGGEEFIIILQHCSGKDAITRAQALRLKIEKLLPASIPVTASIGISQAPAKSRVDFDALFLAADEAVYAAKMCGRNCVAFREPVFDKTN